MNDVLSEISWEELLGRLHDPALIVVDVLPRVSFDEHHLAGALSLPVADIPTRAREVLPDLAREIAVYCGNFT